MVIAVAVAVSAALLVTPLTPVNAISALPPLPDDAFALMAASIVRAAELSICTLACVLPEALMPALVSMLPAPTSLAIATPWLAVALMVPSVVIVPWLAVRFASALSRAVDVTAPVRWTFWSAVTSR
ncbi:hypothetical protein D9M68_968210 [compost metagenome]